MSETKTIAAISTPLSPSGIGVIRVSGKDAIAVCDRVFKGTSPLSDVKGYTCRFGKLYDLNGEFIDETVATVFIAPKSYTGEDTVEFSCHGSPVLLRQTLRALVDNGAAVAGKGEFTKRALLNKKLSLTEAEAVIDIINAESSLAAKCAFSNKNGGLSKKLHEICSTLINLQGEISAIIDFPDEDLSDIPRNEISSRLNDALLNLKSLHSSFSKGQLVMHGIPTAIVGKPNAGKSSVMNTLARAQKSIVTDIPGTTRDIVETRISLGDVILNLSDTAGIRETDDAVESIGVMRAKEKITESYLILCVFDGSAPLSDEDMQIIKETDGANRIAVINKSDIGVGEAAEIIKKYFEKSVIISAKTGAGTELLENMIKEAAGLEGFDPDSGIIANERQYEAVSSALSSLKEAAEAIESGATEDIVGLLLEETISQMLILTGEKASDKIIENVFSRFCVGK